ncbi:MAG: hypothetical protein ACTSYI_10850 [Promethearchaeota archaeon]
MDEQTPKSSTKNDDAPKSPEINSSIMIDLPQESESPLKISHGDFRPFPSKTPKKVIPISEVNSKFEPFILKYTARPRYDPYLPGISTVNQYFPEYEALFKYLNFCTQSFGLPQKNLEDLKDLKGPKNTLNKVEKIPTTEPLSQKSLPFPLYKKALVTAPPGHGIFDFLSLYCQIHKFHLSILDVSINPKDSLTISQIDFDESIANYIKNPLHLPGIFVFQIHNSQMIDSKVVEQKISLMIHDLRMKNFPAVGLVMWDSQIFDLVHFTSEIDFCFQFSSPSQENRTHFLAALPSLIPKNAIDFEHIARQLEGWNFHEIQDFYRACQQYFFIENYFLNRKGESPAITTEFVLDLLVTGTFSSRSEYYSNPDNKSSIEKNKTPSNPLGQALLTSSKGGSFSANSNFAQQLYQEAATHHYNELTLILDKLQKGILLQKEELSLLGDYPFLLKDPPETALHKLQNAQIRVNQLKSLK